MTTAPTDGQSPTAEPAAPVRDNAALPVALRSWRVIKIAAFLVLGPPLGGFLVGLPTLWFGFGDLVPADNMPYAVLLIALFSYGAGTLPALATGIVATRYWPQARGWSAHAWTGLVGFALSALCGGAVFVLFGSYASLGDIALMLWLCGLPGLVGATSVSLLLQLVARLLPHRMVRAQAPARQAATSDVGDASP